MLQVTDDLIRNVVQDVLAHMRRPAAKYTTPPGIGAPHPGAWGVFDNVDEAVRAFGESVVKLAEAADEAERRLG